MASKLTGRRILVVEDEYFIASDIKRALQSEDAVVVGPVGYLAKGLALAASEPLDAAILDVNLEGATSYALADRLADADVPYLFITGYDGWSMPTAYRESPRIGKPFAPRAIVDAVTDLVGSTVP